MCVCVFVCVCVTEQGSFGSSELLGYLFDVNFNMSHPWYIYQIPYHTSEKRTYILGLSFFFFTLTRVRTNIFCIVFMGKILTLIHGQSPIFSSYFFAIYYYATDNGIGIYAYDAT